jgi:L-amino acid N-acyltransferase YncA
MNDHDLTDLVIIDVMISSDWDDVVSIYLQGIAGGNATFETRAPDWESWDRSHLRIPRLVARRGEELVGWAALSPVSARAVYAGVAEVSVYVAGDQQGRGVGMKLLEHLIRESESAGIWTLQAGIFPENVASIRLHEKNGFRVVGTRERLGRFHDGRWRDVTLLERRSDVAGVD